jgi:uncharacterized protein YjbI with pentapeptide repeats
VGFTLKNEGDSSVRMSSSDLDNAGRYSLDPGRVTGNHFCTKSYLSGNACRLRRSTVVIIKHVLGEVLLRIPGRYDLMGVNLKGLNLAHADLSGMSLDGADLPGANSQERRCFCSWSS